jgi:hypothetical protein
MPIILEEKITSKFMPEPMSGCWIWIGAIGKGGYGNISYWKEKKTYRAHRLIYQILVGPIPQGLELDHLCRNRRCVNPAHLEPVTRLENLLRGQTVVAHNSTKNFCNKGHSLSGDNVRMHLKRFRTCRICFNAMARTAYHKRRLLCQ